MIPDSASAIFNQDAQNNRKDSSKTLEVFPSIRFITQWIVVLRELNMEPEGTQWPARTSEHQFHSAIASWEYCSRISNGCSAGRPEGFDKGHVLRNVELTPQAGLCTEYHVCCRLTH